MFVSPKHSQFQKKMRKPKHLRSCSLISIQFLPLSCIMTPCRTEKIDFSKKNNLKKTESPKKQIDRKNHQKKQKKQEKNKKKTQKSKKNPKKIKPAFSAVFFVFLVFFLGFGFLVCFFLVALFFFIFFRQTLYSLCCWTQNSCNARFPQSDLKIIGSSDSLEVKACRPIKTQ